MESRVTTEVKLWTCLFSFPVLCLHGFDILDDQASYMWKQKLSASLKDWSETTKNVLIASTYIPLKCNKFAKYTSDLLSVCPRILLSGPVDSDLYQEMLTKALAKHFGAKLLIVDSLLLPGGSMVKEVDLIKENSMSERATVLAKCAEHPATMYCKNSVSGVEADIPGGSPITSKTYTFKKGDRVKYRGGLKSGFSPGQTPLR